MISGSGPLPVRWEGFHLHGFSVAAGCPYQGPTQTRFDDLQLASSKQVFNSLFSIIKKMSKIYS